MFRISWFNYGEYNKDSYDFVNIVYDIEKHVIVYETANGVKHILCCDFSSIYAELRELLYSDAFIKEILTSHGYDGDYFEFEYNINVDTRKVKGYLYNAPLHEKMAELVRECAEPVLVDEHRLLTSNWGRKEDGTIDFWALEILTNRQKLNSESFSKWVI